MNDATYSDLPKIENSYDLNDESVVGLREPIRHDGRLYIPADKFDFGGRGYDDSRELPTSGVIMLGYSVIGMGLAIEMSKADIIQLANRMLEVANLIPDAEQAA